MNLSDRPISSPEAVLQTGFNNYALLFQPLYDDLVVLETLGLEIWRALDGKHSLAEIAARIKAQYSDAPADVAADVDAFLKDLQRRGFLESEPAEQRFQKLSRRPQPAPAEPAIDLPEPLLWAGLSLADGSRWNIAACDEPARRVLAQFASSAGLTLALQNPLGGQALRLATFANPQTAEDEHTLLLQPAGMAPAFSRRPAESPAGESEWLWQQLWRLSAFITHQVLAGGGLLLHGALACFSPADGGAQAQAAGLRTGAGVLLAGRSGVGKSTASSRLPAPWHSLCDDTALVVRDGSGAFWAHPWPTWSRIYEQHYADSWDVQAAVPLQAICVLEQSPRDAIQPAARHEAIVMLMGLTRAAARHRWLPGRKDADALHQSQLQRFANVGALAKNVPVYLLDVTLQGTFWSEIEKVLAHVRC